MAWVATAIGGSAVLGYVGSQKQAAAAEKASQRQADAAAAAAQQQREMFDILNQQQQPYRQAGYTALNRINQMMGLPAAYYEQPAVEQPYQQQVTGGGSNAMRGAISQLAPIIQQWKAQEAQPAQQLVVPDRGPAARPTGIGYGTAIGGVGNKIQEVADRINAAANANKPMSNVGMQAPTTPGYNPQGADFGSLNRMFTAEDLKTSLAPNYQFMLGQGLGATRQSANVGGGGSNAQRAATKFAEDYASNAYQQALQNYTGQQQNIYNRLSNLAGIGQSAQNQVQSLGQTTAANIGQLGIGGATALGAGQIGAANAQAAGLQGIGNSLMMPMMMGGGNSGGSLFGMGGTTENTLYANPIPAGQWSAPGMQSPGMTDARMPINVA